MCFFKVSTKKKELKFKKPKYKAKKILPNKIPENYKHCKKYIEERENKRRKI